MTRALEAVCCLFFFSTMPDINRSEMQGDAMPLAAYATHHHRHRTDWQGTPLHTVESRGGAPAGSPSSRVGETRGPKTIPELVVASGDTHDSASDVNSSGIGGKPSAKSSISAFRSSTSPMEIDGVPLMSLRHSTVLSSRQA